MTSELTSSEYFELIGELIPELTSSQCNWKGNRKGKGTDETPHSKASKPACMGFNVSFQMFVWSMVQVLLSNLYTVVHIHTYEISY